MKCCMILMSLKQTPDASNRTMNTNNTKSVTLQEGEQIVLSDEEVFSQSSASLNRATFLTARMRTQDE